MPGVPAGLNVPGGRNLRGISPGYPRAGCSRPGRAGGPRGDLYCYVRIKPHEFLERNGNDLIVSVPISFTQAALGTSIDVPTLDGPRSLKIPAGTQPNRVFRLRGKGVPDVHGRGTGDELVRINVVIPTSLTSEARRHIEEFARATGETFDSKESIVDKIKRGFK